MPDRLNLRLRMEDHVALDTAARIIAGTAGAPHIRRCTVLRHVLAAFNAQHEAVPRQEPTT